MLFLHIHTIRPRLVIKQVCINPRCVSSVASMHMAQITTKLVLGNQLVLPELSSEVDLRRGADGCKG